MIRFPKGHRLSTKEQTEVTKSVCELFNVRWWFYAKEADAFAAAWADPEKGEVYISYQEGRTYSYLMSFLMHEICHVLAYRQGKFMNYHAAPYDDWTKDALLKYKKCALRAEVWVEKQTQKWSKVLDFRFENSYDDRGVRKAFTKKVNDFVTEELNRLETES